VAASDEFIPKKMCVGGSGYSEGCHRSVLSKGGQAVRVRRFRVEDLGNSAIPDGHGGQVSRSHLDTDFDAEVETEFQMGTWD
jgi:hypothetical protein